MITRVDVRRGRYHDSVALMRVSRDIGSLPGIVDALVAMATDLNVAVLTDMGFDPSAAHGARAEDLLLAVRAVDDAALSAAWEAIDVALAPPLPAAAGAFSAPEPRTIEAAARLGDANLAVISVPGAHAFVEAMAALRAGLHVMIFSDNVPLAQEVALKAYAAEHDLLVMGPDCGTSIVGGVGLGFANVVRPGPVSITGASGTGIQQITCLLDDAGVGIRHALGTGSRDLSTEVNAGSTLRALGALDADPQTEVVVIVSKPPAPAVAEHVREAAQASATPTVVAFLGEGATTLESAAAETLRILDRPFPTPASWPSHVEPSATGSLLVGLFSGGTLRDEARDVVAPLLGPVAASEAAPSHRLIDLGGDEYTRGRPHPMIDQRLRIDYLSAASRDPQTGVILLDVVLGHGAQPDPAGELAPAVTDATSRGVPVVVSLCGSRDDPQDRDRQARVLQDAGASVWLSNAAAARVAVQAVAQ